MTDDPVLKALAGFTPNPTVVDRDALLFQAGQASARPNRRWKAACLVLAVGQTATLAGWLTAARDHPAAAPPVVPAPGEPAPPASTPADPNFYAALLRVWSADGPPPPTAYADPPPPVPSLTAGSLRAALD